MADMQALLTGFLDLLMKAFPTSPFADTIEKFSKLPYLGYINWFVPVSEMVAIGSAWLLAVAPLVGARIEIYTTEYQYHFPS